VFGVVGNSLVAASDAPSAAALASARAHFAAGANGGAVLSLNARDLVTRLLARRLRGAAGLLAPLAASSFRDLTGSLQNDRSALRGHFKLTIVK